MMNSFSQLTNPNLTVRAFFYAKKYATQVHDVTAIFTSLITGFKKIVSSSATEIKTRR